MKVIKNPVPNTNAYMDTVRGNLNSFLGQTNHITSVRSPEALKTGAAALAQPLRNFLGTRITLKKTIPVGNRLSLLVSFC
jgi:hypothetical protein